MFDRYRPLLKLPGAWWLLASSLAGRLPLSTNPLAVLLLMRATTHSFSDSGAASGAIALAEAGFAPLIGRMLDRINLTALIGPTAIIQALSMLALVICAEAHVPVPMLLVICAIVGASMPPVSACARMMWGRLAPTRDLRDTAYALDSTAQEIVWTTGPVIVGGLVAAFSAEVAALAVTAISFVGIAWFVVTAWRIGLAASVAEPSQRAKGKSALSIFDAHTAVLVAVGFVIGVSFGALEVALPALAEKLGAAGLSGVLLAIWSGGSMLGGILFGVRRWGMRAERLMALLFLVNAILAIPVAFATDIPWALGGCLLAGTCGAPILASMATLIADNTPASAVGEAFTWNTAAIVSGIAIGAALSGVIVSSVGVTAAVFLSVCAGLLASVTSFVARDKFRVAETVEEPVTMHA